MAPIRPAYALALLRAARPRDLARALLRRVRPRPPEPAPIGDREERLAALTLARAPGLLAPGPTADALAALFPGAPARIARRAERILDGEVELFGRAARHRPGESWRRDPFTGAPAGSGRLDPKPAWELARAGHLVELGAAARASPRLTEPARAAITADLAAFLDENPVGEGIHYASPLEMAMRAVGWLGALELAGGAAAFAPRLWARLAGRLLADARFLAAHLEDGGVAPANHLLGDWVGIWRIALALDGAPGMRALRDRARVALEREAARQVGRDGAHFEASTGYHRFALELLLVAHRAAAAAGAPLAVEAPLRRMFGYLRGILAPDGTVPRFGDGDDARLLAIVPRAPESHAYLLPLGAALFGDPALKPSRLLPSEETLWWLGPEAVRSYARLPFTGDPGAASFPTGGVHVLRARGLWVALRSGPHGQRGVGGHAHNDQLSVVVHAAGRPLIVDAGTGAYTPDTLLRDRFRGTAAHATVVVDGAEQSPLYDGRPFALPDRARAPAVRVEDRGERARLEAAHDGYRRLPSRVRHRRAVTVDRRARVLLIDDAFEGRGSIAVELRFPLLDEPRAAAGPVTRARLEELRPLVGPIDPDAVIQLDGRAALVPPAGFRSCIVCTAYSPRYGAVERRPLVSISARLTLSAKVRTAIVLIP